MIMMHPRHGAKHRQRRSFDVSYPDTARAQGERMTAKNSTLRYVELIVLFFAVPCALYFIRQQLAFRVFYLLILVSAACTFILLKDASFDRAVFKRSLISIQIRSILQVFLPAGLLLLFFTYFFLPSKFIAFPTAKPLVWAIVMILYPILLVLPQELLFRCFFFHRYQTLFDGHPRLFMVLNALSFGLSHLFYANWVAPTLSFFGGLLFAWRYHRSQSLLAVTVEHAIWGNFLFTTGIGWYFYSGSIH